MNRPIRNLATACMVLFLALMANASYLQFFAAENLNSLTEHPNNARVANYAFSAPRGTILVNGRVVATSKEVDDQFKYLRVYPDKALYAHLAGYFGRSRIGAVEASQNSVLTGEDPELFVNRLGDILSNKPPVGGNVILTVDAKAQKAAYDGLQALGKNIRGAVVAIEPATGKILAMASSPSFDPNRLATHDFTKATNAYKRLVADELSPLNNRAIEERLPPGSTFKLVTAAAALSTGDYEPDSRVNGNAELKLRYTTIRNYDLRSCGASKISLTRAMEVSCNVAFAEIGLDIGPEALKEQAEKFGFNGSDPYFTDLDDPLTSQVSSVFPELDPKNREQVAQSSIGQFDVAATPLQMAMVTAAIANRGRLMKPYLVDEIRSADLDVIKPFNPEVLSQSVTAAVASKLTDMLVSTVENGTAGPARISGVSVAGKTGTAQSARDRPPYAWFVSFAPADNAKVAVAVLIQSSDTARDEISGSRLAAPIAKAVMEAVVKR